MTLALSLDSVYAPAMKLQQGQVWKCANNEYVRIVHLERLEVGYKAFKSLNLQEGIHQHTSKKDFCRLLKGATLQAEVKKLDPRDAAKAKSNPAA